MTWCHLPVAERYHRRSKRRTPLSRCLWCLWAAFSCRQPITLLPSLSLLVHISAFMYCRIYYMQFCNHHSCSQVVVMCFRPLPGLGVACSIPEFLTWFFFFLVGWILPSSTFFFFSMKGSTLLVCYLYSWQVIRFSSICFFLSGCCGYHCPVFWY